MHFRAKATGRTLAGFALALSAFPLLSADADIVKSRIAGYREIGAAFKALQDSFAAKAGALAVAYAVSTDFRF